MTKLEIEVGRGLRDAATEVAAAWKAAEKGRTVRATNRVYFQDWNILCAVLTPKRLELLRHLRRSPEGGVRPLARALGRDVKRVHEDVTALANLGFISRGEDGGLSSSVNVITSKIHIAA